MSLFRIFMVILAGFFIRRLWVAGRRRTAPPPSGPGPAQDDNKLDDLTQQGISDADYEEIP